MVDAKPSVFGKTVDLDTAILEIKRIINKSDQIHLTGMDCDISSIDNILGSQRNLNVSLDHMDGEKNIKSLSIDTEERVIFLYLLMK